jgi:hypothetical protein
MLSTPLKSVQTSFFPPKSKPPAQLLQAFPPCFALSVTVQFPKNAALLCQVLSFVCIAKNLVNSMPNTIEATSDHLRGGVALIGRYQCGLSGH